MLVRAGCTRRRHKYNPPRAAAVQKSEKLTNALATPRTEWTGISSSDAGCAECDTSSEWMEVSSLYSFLRPVSCSGVAVVLTIARLKVDSPGKRWLPLRKSNRRARDCASRMNVGSDWRNRR